jgi:RNA polymerase sigma-70 factor (ECF subfamily)
MKTWKILRDCRLKGSGVHCAMLGVRGAVRISRAACRQLASSARRRIRTSQTPASPTARQAAIVRNFKQAWEAQDIGALIGLLDADVTATGDGGGLATTERRPLEDAEHSGAASSVSPAGWPT